MTDAVAFTTILADGSEEVAVLIGAVAGAVVTVIGAGGAIYLKILIQRGKDARSLKAAEIKHENAIVEELRGLLDAQRELQKEDRNQIHKLRDDLGALTWRYQLCEKEREALTNRVSALEAAARGGT